MKNSISHVCRLLVIIQVLYFTQYANADTLITADDPRISYYGRFDHSKPESPKCTWSGSAIEASFHGPRIGFRLIDGTADFDVEIDNESAVTIRPDFETREFIIREDLSEDIHTIRIIRRSENHYTTCIFRGFYLADGKDLAEPPDPPERRIEFIGDSYTVGYGNESPGRTCSQDQLREYTNTNRSFPSIVTRAFGAQSMILGWSGAGMVRNYGYSKKRSPKPYPYHYNRTLGEVESTQWDFTRYIPDLVVICLGTNDFSTEPHPDDTMYIGDYHNFINRIYGNYPNASVLCVATHNGPCVDYVKSVVDEQNTQHGHERVYYTEFPDPLSMQGCDWHPTVEDDERIAGVLIDVIKEKMEWDTGSTILEMAAATPRKSVESRFSLVRKKGCLTIALKGSLPLPSSLNVYAADGMLVREVLGNGQRTVAISTRGLNAGLYIIGNRTIGFKKITLHR